MTRALILTIFTLTLVGCDRMVAERDADKCKPGYVFVYITGGVCIPGYRP